MDVGLFFTLFSLLFLAISFLFLIFSNIIFTLVSVLFLNPFMDFDSVNKSTLICLHAGSYVVEVPDHVYITIGEDKCQQSTCLL